MIALQIEDMKFFMKKLLLSESFDHFLLVEANITTFNTFHINGRLKKEYFTAEEQELLENRSFSYWKEVRPFCLELIKGKKTPLSFQFTLQLSKANTEKFLLQTDTSIKTEQVQGLLINLHYHEKKLLCTTGTSLSFFSLDKKIDHAWDSMVQKFLHQQEIPFTIPS